MSTIFWAADSTVQYNDITTYPQTGMGQVMHLYLKPEVTVSNHAKNGRSTKSFLDEGRFAPIAEQIAKDDFLFIQFGHNDEKIADPTRYTTPEGTYADNLRLMIATAKKVGAHPVLITSLERAKFAEGKLLPSEHTPYVEAMKKVGKEENVPVIDLCAMSGAKLQEVGEEQTQSWFMCLPEGVYPSHPEGLHDTTHLKYAGAVLFAGMIAKGLQDLGGIYADLLVYETN